VIIDGVSDDEVLDHIRDGYQLKEVPEDWEDRVRAVLADTNKESEVRA